MPRLAPLLVALALLAGAAGAFAITEHLKLEQPPLRAPLVERAFAPGCRCPNPTASLAFRLSKPDVVSVDVLDARGDVVRHLLRDARRPAGRVLITWDGRDDAGAIVRQATYRYRVHLARRDRTIELPFGPRVDIVPPRIAVVSAAPLELRQGVDGHAPRVKVRYLMSERGTALIFVDGRRRVRSRLHRRRGELDWYARAERKALPPGVYRLSLVAEDLAGNRSRARLIRVRIRPRSASG